MFRAVARVSSAAHTVIRQSLKVQTPAVTALRNSSGSSGPQETDEEFDRRYVEYFNRADIDNWEIRKAMTDILQEDLIPEPQVIEAGLRAARRLNDLGVAMRFLEAVYYKSKHGMPKNQIWAYLEQELKPTLTELGIPTPQELGYADKPELWLSGPNLLHR